MFFSFCLIKKKQKIKKKRSLPAIVQLSIAFFQGLRTVNKLHFSAVLCMQYLGNERVCEKLFLGLYQHFIFEDK
jgi:hypothetical protein